MNQSFVPEMDFSAPSPMSDPSLKIEMPEFAILPSPPVNNLAPEYERRLLITLRFDTAMHPYAEPPQISSLTCRPQGKACRCVFRDDEWAQTVRYLNSCAQAAFDAFRAGRTQRTQYTDRNVDHVPKLQRRRFLETYGQIDPAVVRTAVEAGAETLNGLLSHRGIFFDCKEPNNETPGVYGPDTSNYSLVVNIYVWALKGKFIGQVC